MIKVGQVYKYTAEPSTRFVVTAAFDENTRFDYILNDGDVIEENGKLKTSGVHRTGCMFCMYGVHLEPLGKTRFDIMKKTHPKQYNYIMEKLNGKHVSNEYLKCDSVHCEPLLFEEINDEPQS